MHVPSSKFQVPSSKFQVLDHVVDPLNVMTNVARVLKPGGYFITVTHNVKSWQPRLFGEGCPMFDVQHIFLWDLNTIRGLIEKVGLRHIRSGNISVQYSLGFVVRMLPLPMRMRSWIISILKFLGMDAMSCAWAVAIWLPSVASWNSDWRMRFVRRIVSFTY